MAKREIPSWVMNGTPEPPIVAGYWDYGIVWSADWARPRFWWLREMARQTYWALWSWHYWGKKVRRAWKHTVTDAWAYLVHGTPWPLDDSRPSPQRVQGDQPAA